MINMGNYLAGEVVNMPFNTYGANGESVTVTNLAVGDVEVYKDGGATKRASVSGITLSLNHNGVTGRHLVNIDTSDNDDPGFYAAGSDYEVSFEGITIATQTLNPFAGIFSIQNRFMRGTDSAALASALSTHDGKLDVVDGIADDILALLDNKLFINKATSTLELYNAAGDTVIKRWPLTDKDGAGIVLQGTGPANRDDRTL